MTILGQLAALRDSIYKDTRTNQSPGRPVPVFLEREFSWEIASGPVEKFGELRNYAPGELRIHALGATVESGATASSPGKVLIRNQCGYSDRDDSLSDFFDFEWNITYASSGARYGIPGHTDKSPYLSSECFRGQDAGTRFDITTLRLGLNESIQIHVRPTYWTSEPAAFLFVRFQLWGTRAYV